MQCHPGLSPRWRSALRLTLTPAAQRWAWVLGVLLGGAVVLALLVRSGVAASYPGLGLVAATVWLVALSAVLVMAFRRPPPS